MVLGFKTQINGKPTGFVEKIQNGTKIHTIREDNSLRWEAGKSIQFATGVRTKDYHKFMDGTCTGVQSILISVDHDDCILSFTVRVDGRDLTYEEIEKLAVNDGFAGILDFFDWFNEDFTGKIIHWTDHRY